MSRHQPAGNKKVKEKGTAYLLHFHAPYKHARHYLGWIPTRNLKARLLEHHNGQGSPLIAAVHRAGITWQLARTWHHKNEASAQRLRRTQKPSVLCPVCRRNLDRKPQPPKGTRPPIALDSKPATRQEAPR